MDNGFMADGRTVMVGGTPYIYSNTNIPPAFQNIASQQLRLMASTPVGLNKLIADKRLIPIGASSSTSSSPSSFNTASISTNYTPNQYTANQLAGIGSGMGGNANTIPQWMQQSYANKMNAMGGASNGPMPYQLTESSFRGMPAIQEPAAAAPVNANPMNQNNPRHPRRNQSFNQQGAPSGKAASPHPMGMV